MTGAPLITGRFVADRFGIWAGVAAGIAALVASIFGVVAFYRIVGRWHEQEQCELSEKYPSIYRVVAVPTDAGAIVKAEGAEIEIGDYGWEAEPIHKDERIYLHGLTAGWQVVWHAGFTQDQIERIGPKPRSQYYLPYLWRGVNSDAPPCPFPVRTHWANDLGCPQRVFYGWVQGIQAEAR